MLDLDDKQTFHGIVPCPACEQPVHVIGALADRAAVWSCTACHTVGSAPIFWPSAEGRPADANLPC